MTWALHKKVKPIPSLRDTSDISVADTGSKKKNLSHTALNLSIVWLKRVMSKQVTACANADCVRSLGALTSVTYLSWCNGEGMLHRPSSIRRQRSRALDRLLVECGGVAASSQSVRNVRNQTHFRNRWTAHWVHSTPRTPRIHETNRGARAGQEELQKLSLSFFKFARTLGCFEL